MRIDLQRPPITNLFILVLVLLIIMSTTTPTSATGSDMKANNKRCSSDIPKHLQKRGKIILLGDSITQMSFSAKLSGWGSYIADIYQRRCDVYNRGMSGYNTDWFLQYLNTKEGHFDVFGMMTNGQKEETTEEIMHPNDEVKLVTIFFGANDASCETLNPRHHVPISRFESNLKQIVTKCQTHFGSSVKIIFITPPPVCHKKRLEYQIQRYKEKASGKLERTLSLSGDYASAVERIAKELKIPCLNIWKEMQQLEGEEEEGKKPWSIYLSDGLHLSKEGNLFVGEKLAELIAQVYPDVAVTPCPFTDYTGNSASIGGLELGSEGGIGPWHDEIDHLDVESAFNGNHKKTKL